MLAHIKLLTFSLTLGDVHPVHGLSKQKTSADSSTVSVLLSRPAPTIIIIKFLRGQAREELVTVSKSNQIAATSIYHRL